MAESDFPSGAWTGFFMQPLAPGRHTMDLEMRFRDGQVRGRGRDWVGEFSIDGEYDRSTGECRWTKHYHGRHDVTYVGRNEGQGIWGVWELAQLLGMLRGRGVFHIWPVGMTPTREADLTELAMSRGELRWSPALAAIGFVVALLIAAAGIALHIMLDRAAGN
jgi:hypothetical protein